MPVKKPRKLPKYRSKFEATVADQLRKKKVQFGYEDIRLDYKVPESKHYYKPDFNLSNGLRIEVKGKFDADARKKMILIKEQHPNENIKLLFMRDQPIRKGSETFYSDWCRKYGYDFAFQNVPAEWLNE